MTSSTLIRPEPRVDVRHRVAVVSGGPVDRYRRSHGAPPRPLAHGPSSGAASHRAARRPRYALRRLAVAGIVTVVLLGAVPALGAVLASVGGSPAAAADAVPGTSPAADRAARHVAAPGDTMWSIAQQHRGAISHADYVDALIRLNGGVGIEVGQAVVLP